MNLRQVRYFCEVVDSGSAAAAADRLHVAPTAISMQLAQLEADFGGELFDRSRRPMELTALGRHFYPRAKELLTNARRLEEEVRSVAAGKSGSLPIGYTRSSIFSILPAAVRAFRATHPKVQIELIELLSEHQNPQVLNGRLQIGISRYIGLPEPVEGLTFTALLDEPFVAALPASHVLARRKSVKVRELAPTPLICYPKDPESRFASQTIALLVGAGIQPLVGYEANEIHTALGMVASGLGYCLVGRSVSKGNRADLAFVHLADLPATAKVVAVTKTAETSKVVASFVQTLIATIARDQPGA
jgi:DNA-binding transcriptional LysR family regulator